MVKCSLCGHPILPTEPSEYVAGNMRAHLKCPTPKKSTKAQPAARNFREHVSLDDTGDDTTPLKERELREDQ